MANHFGDDVTDLLIVAAVGVGAYFLWSKYSNTGNAAMGGTDFGTDSSSGGGSSWGADAGSGPATSDVTVSFPGG